MKRSSSGFTILELMIVLMVGGVITSIAVRSFSDVRDRLIQRQSQRAFQAMNARARAMAIESGTFVKFNLDTSGDSIWIERNDTTLELVNMMTEYGTDIVASATVMTNCFNSRGYADASCTSYSTMSVAGFRSAGVTRYIFMLPMGGMVEQIGS